MLCTHLNVYVLSVRSRYQSNLGEIHLVVVKNILKYLQMTNNTFLVYGGEEELALSGDMDAIFEINRYNGKSQSSFLLYLNGGVVS
jgi:hypothetical protein